MFGFRKVLSVARDSPSVGMFRRRQDRVGLVWSCSRDPESDHSKERRACELTDNYRKKALIFVNILGELGNEGRVLRCHFF